MKKISIVTVLIICLVCYMHHNIIISHFSCDLNNSSIFIGLALTKNIFNHLVGVAEDANECFSEATALRLQQEQTSTSNMEKSNFVNENRVLSSNVSASLVDISPKQIKHLPVNNSAEVPGYPHLRATALHVQNSVHSNVGQFDSPSPTVTQVSRT